MRGNSHVRFLGEEATAMSLPYPTGKGMLVSFNPFVEMVIVFNGNGRKGRMKNIWRSFASSYMDDVSVDGVPIRSLVDYGDSRWYPIGTPKHPE